MSTYIKKRNIPELESVGKLLANQLHEAREKKGFLECPACHASFDGTYRIKCPECRLLISNTFPEVRAQKTLNLKKMNEVRSEKIIKKKKVRSQKSSEKLEVVSKKTAGKQKVGAHKISEKMELDFFALLRGHESSFVLILTNV